METLIYILSFRTDTFYVLSAIYLVWLGIPFLLDLVMGEDP